MLTEAVQRAVDYLVDNAGQRPRELARNAVKEAMTTVEEAALLGLPSTTILTLAHKVVFTNGYDQITRRRLLYCLVPEDSSFPLQVVPLAVSSAGVKDVSVAWQHAVLAWLQGLLEYGIISPSEPLVHITYTAVFNHTASLSLCTLACRILYHITVQQDVTPNRIQTLLRLRHKPAFNIPVSYLLRLYHLYRPDMVQGRLGDRNVATRTLPALKARLLGARQRLQQGLAEVLGHHGRDRVWRDSVRVEKLTVHQRPTPIPQCEFTQYTTTLEEKKGKVIYVTQYQRFRELVRGLKDWERWVWPSNGAAHLACPLVVPLFRPHQPHIQVFLTNWLEVALRTEVVEAVGVPSVARQDSLLRAAYSLCFTQAAAIPVISHFLVELMAKWNQQEHYEKVVRLLEFVGFTSLAALRESLVPLVSRLLTVAPLVTWCRVVEAVTLTACRWLLAAQQHDATASPEGSPWPQQAEELERPLVGVWFLTERLERLFLAGVLHHRGHTLVLHHILDYYYMVDMYSQELKLPASFSPPATLTLAILCAGDPAATHRIARQLARVKMRRAWLEEVHREGCQDPVLEDSLQRCAEANTAVFLLLSGVLQGKALSPAWQRLLEPFYPFKHLQETLAQGEVAAKCMSVSHALPYMSLVCGRQLLGDQSWVEEEFEDLQEQMLEELREAELTGLEECSKMYARE